MTTDVVQRILIAVGATTAMIVLAFIVVWLLIEFVNFSREWFPWENDDDSTDEVS